MKNTNSGRYIKYIYTIAVVIQEGNNGKRRKRGEALLKEIQSQSNNPSE